MTPQQLKKLLKAKLEFSREPTEYEIRFGYGARHYKDFDSTVFLKKDGTIKKRLKCPVDGLIYTRSLH